jgi:tRNA (uracil-5-)-methyltransferase TRM9
MKQQTVNALQRLTHDFYEQVGEFWNHDPRYYWEGWSDVLPYIKDSRSFLDIGCGNGRFANFIQQYGCPDTDQLDYVGIDYSSQLLSHADIPNFARLINADIHKRSIYDIVSEYKIGNFDVVVLFGVLHHIPSFEARLRLLRQSFDMLRPGGILIFTTWQFLEVPRLSKRIVPIDSEICRDICEQYHVDPSEFEKGDYILDWNKMKISYRYAHAFTESEIRRYLISTCATTIQTFQIGGRSGKRNKFYITTK